MKIPFNHRFGKVCEILCPHCNTKDIWKHGVYTRTWFHSLGKDVNPKRKVQRYLCRNQPCPCRTFTVQVCDVLPCCRFLWCDLLTVTEHLFSGQSYHHISRVLCLSRSVLRRISGLLVRMVSFLQVVCRELSDGEVVIAGIEQGFEQAQTGYCWIALKALWFRHNYRHWYAVTTTPHN